MEEITQTYEVCKTTQSYKYVYRLKECTMKKTKRIKSRHARVLFAKDSPFTHKVVPDKTKYNRKKNPRKVGDFSYLSISFIIIPEMSCL